MAVYSALYLVRYDRLRQSQGLGQLADAGPADLHTQRRRGVASHALVGFQRQAPLSATMTGWSGFGWLAAWLKVQVGGSAHTDHQSSMRLL